MIRRRSWLVRLGEQEVVKFLPRNPPRRGDTVLVDGERCKVVSSKVTWNGPQWEIHRLRVKRA